MTESERAAVGIEGFGMAPRYQTARPGYPAAAVSHLVQYLHIESTTRVVDVAAGTGFSRESFCPSPRAVVAVEPGPGMRDEFAVQLPAVEVFDGAAENCRSLTRRPT